jgi:hypothetical protein
MPPTWAGAIWSPRARNWIAEHIDDFIFVGDEVVDGIPTKVVKAPLSNKYSHDTAEIFEVHHEGTSKGAELRLYIAPSLGYALPRADGLTEGGGEVVQRVEQTDFRQYTDTIYLPSKTEKKMVGKSYSPTNKGGIEVIRELYTLSDIQMVNEAIPESDFIIPVPAGVEVVDLRDRQHPVLFKTTEAGVSTDVEKKATNLSEVPR